MFPLEKEFLVRQQQYADLIHDAEMARMLKNSNVSAAAHLRPVVRFIKQLFGDFTLPHGQLPQSTAFSS